MYVVTIVSIRPLSNIRFVEGVTDDQYLANLQLTFMRAQRKAPGYVKEERVHSKDLLTYTVKIWWNSKAEADAFQVDNKALIDKLVTARTAYYVNHGITRTRSGAEV